SDILREERSEPGPYRPAWIRTIRQPDARSEVVVVGAHQRVAEPAVTRDLHGGPEAEGHPLVEIAAAGAHDGRMMRRIEGRRDLRIDQAVVLGRVRRCELVAQPQAYRQIRTDFPGVVEIVILPHAS